MSFFIDKHNRRKTTIALTAFCLGFGFLCLFAVLALLLAEPLHQMLRFESEGTTAIAHSLIVALLGTAVCCLAFLLKDKRVAPYSFAGLAVWLGMFYAAAFLLEGEARGGMIRLISMFALAPALVGNAVTWLIYLKMKRGNPALNHRKTIREELKEAVARETAGGAEKNSAKPAEKEETLPQPEAPMEEFVSEPETGAEPHWIYRLDEKEAMLLYDEPEASDD